VRHRNEFFDESFDSYKEDIDLALRLLRRGWRSRFVPGARAYHYRRVGGERRMTADALARHAKRPTRIALLSYRNHLYTLLKNETFLSCRRDLPWIIGWEIAKMVFLLGTKPMVVFRAWGEIIRNWGRLKEKRHQIQNSKSKAQNNGVPPQRDGILSF
jgi:GT2 family glycosyltransferase